MIGLTATTGTPRERAAARSASIPGTARIGPIDTIGFDADDTLWKSEDYFTVAEELFVAKVGPYAPPGIDVLAALRRSGPRHELNPKHLLETVMLSSGGMTKRLDQLEHAGLVKRSPDPGDRRGTLVRLTPRISYFSADGSGTIEVTEAATQMIVPSGRPVVLAGATSETHAVLRQILGVRSERTATETLVVLTATAQ